MNRLPDTNIFVIPNNTYYIIYAPVRGLVFSANAEAVEQLRQCCAKQDITLLGDDIRKALGGGDWIFKKDPLKIPTADGPFQPNSVTLFLHSLCNLRCIYCYAEAGDKPAQQMDEQLWRSAIEFAFSHAQSLNKPLQIGFHGGGEPTLAWAALTTAVEYAQKVTRDHTPGLGLSLVSNGVLSDDKIDFITENFPGIVLSLDGPVDIQNRQRPKADGTGSYDDVMRTVDRLRERNFRFAIRSTITSSTVRRMAEMVDFFVEKTGCRNLFFEPAFGCGRAGADGIVPGYDAFAEAFIRAFRRGRDLKAGVFYSATRLPGRKLSFCGVARGSFNVTPDGLVTSCYEVCDATHPLAGEFVYGSFNRKSGTFSIDPDRLRNLRSLVVPNKPYCDNCFSRWHCAGDCPVRVRGTQVNFQSPSPRCQMNRKILKAILATLVDGKTP